MKLIVQIPCFNEEQSLAKTVADIPRQIDGIDDVRILVIDDGSADLTYQVAQSCNVDYIVQHKHNLGLAKAFSTGIEACLQAGADIIVNTDGDNQYVGRDIPKLIQPILDGKADIVVGDRQADSNPHFSPAKKFLQKLGSSIVRRLSGLDIPDAVSGFRGFSRNAALRLNVISSFSYTIETIIQAGKQQIAVTSVPISTNPKTRESRLFKSLPRFIERSVTTMIRVYAMYKPLRMFFYIGSVLILIGAVPIVRFVIFYFTDGGAGHIQSLVLGGILLVMGFASYLIGLVADLVSVNRRLLETTLEKARRLELASAAQNNHAPEEPSFHQARKRDRI